MTLSFCKYEGLGNDFIVVDLDSESAVTPALARKLCERHFGIGADGVLLVLPPTSSGADARMSVLNADGSRPEMCGNGIRCVALHLARREKRAEARYFIDTDAGLRSCEVKRRDDFAEVFVGMGRGQLLGEHLAEFDGQGHSFTRVSLGNPHAVVFDAGYDEAAIDRFAPGVSAALAGGSNVEFARSRAPNAYDLVVWERGVGRTLACGTGAAATVVAAAVSGRAPFGQPVQVRLPGGPLEISVTSGTLEVFARGPAKLVFTGAVQAP